MDLEQRIEGYLRKRTTQSAYRKLLGNTEGIDFSSNDYLGLSRNPDLLAAVSGESQKLQQHGATGSRLISGNNAFTDDLENALRIHHSVEAALVFSSGYTANLGFFSCVPREGDLVIYDELIHASVHDGLKMTSAKAISFLHNDVDDLRRKLTRSNTQTFIAVESLYSMDGDKARLKEIADLAVEFDAKLIVDEAHANGVYGKNGAGLVEAAGIGEHVFAQIVTFSKAYGCHGGAILGTEQLKEYLINFSRPFIFTTGMSLPSIIGIREALKLMPSLATAREKLEKRVALFRSFAMNSEKTFLPSKTAIQSLVIPGNQRCLEVANYLQESGFNVKAIRPPTVSQGKERIRLSLHSYNTEDEIERLFKSIESCTFA